MYKNQLSQIWFTFSRVTSLLWSINPRFTIAILILSAFWGLLTFPTFYLEKLIIDNIVANIGNPNWQSALRVIIFLVFARVLVETIRNVLSSLLMVFRRFSGQMFYMHLEVLIANKLAKLDAKTIEDPEFQDRFSKVERESTGRAWSLVMLLTDMPNYIFGFASAVAILWFLHPLVALGVVLVSLPTIWVDKFFIRKEYEYAEKISPLHRVLDWLSYFLIRTKNYLEIRILGLQDYLAQRMGELQKEVLEGSMTISKQREKAHFITLVPGVFFYIGVNIYIVVQTLTARITVGSYEMFLRSLLASAQNFSSLIRSFLEIYESYMFVADLQWFLSLEPSLPQNNSGQKIGKIKDGIKFNGVWFRYKDDSSWVIKGVSFKIKVGDKIAIVGQNGAGKSTLIKLLTRFYDPTKGEIIFDGVDVKNLDYNNYQSKFAVLFQNFEVYPFSARESIGYGDVGRLDNITVIQESARRTGIDDYIESLPLKYENPLSPHFPKGVEPSGGQWQRIGIARMFFRENADILVLDEPTANVDPEAEEKIFAELLKKSKSKILVFVSQRFSTVRRADKIIVLDKGKIIEQGTHQQLMEIDGKYKKMFELQAKGYQ